MSCPVLSVCASKCVRNLLTIKPKCKRDKIAWKIKNVETNHNYMRWTSPPSLSLSLEALSLLCQTCVRLWCAHECINNARKKIFSYMLKKSVDVAYQFPNPGEWKSSFPSQRNQFEILCTWESPGKSSVTFISLVLIGISPFQPRSDIAISYLSISVHDLGW